ncbi:branched-chain amino acid ABC transporter permease [Aggregatilineales bacterium SYSU G02658]
MVLSDFWAIFFQALIGGLVVGAIYALIAIGYNLIYATTRVLNFAQGEYLAVGALLGYTFQVTLKLPTPIALLGVVLAMIVVGLITERLIMVPVRRVGGYAWILTTLGVSIIIRNVLAIIYGAEPVNPPPLFDGRITFSGLFITYQQIWIIVAALLLMLLNELFAHRTFLGKAIRATAYSYNVAALMGIPVGLTIQLSFILSAIVTGLAGTLIAPIVFADANMGLILGLKGFVAVVVGGLGSARGALVGGIAVGLLEGFLRAVLPSLLQTSFNWSNIVVFALLALMLLFRPKGLFGQTVADHH